MPRSVRYRGIVLPACHETNSAAQRPNRLTAPQSNSRFYCLLLAAIWRLSWERVSPCNPNRQQE